ncbi:MAG: hypothetical protein GTN62_11545 [Gemmatimonadales bacterium]|nr:hypothetical protein [Gemmatimonadales bacterium]NIN50729.1 hypothetical protein [Gemmatimonadales bacterium]NIP08193.1 hypothetical protein [Gemmatimonadales bacterium]NIR01071.1 hypothetical protein [Gemmatimonadales bacterium]NIS65150.1 hypothetical protein [Gemmatimonadales bacterium]
MLPWQVSDSPVVVIQYDDDDEGDVGYDDFEEDDEYDDEYDEDEDEYEEYEEEYDDHEDEPRPSRRRENWE